MYKKYKFGVVSGKFRILHKGHKEYFIKVITEDIEELHIIICDEVDCLRYSTIDELKQAISEILKEYKVPYYFHICDKNIEVSEDIFNEEWDNTVINFVLENAESRTEENIQKIVIYNGKESYKNNLIDNKKINNLSNKNFSAKMLEKNIYELDNYLNIAPEFAKFLNKKYNISGVESSGKTEICKRLADIIGTTFIEEVGRFYNDDYLGGSTHYEGIYAPKDFVLIAMKQIIQDKEVNLLSKRVVLIDSDPIITLRLLFFYREYYIENNIWNTELENEVNNAELVLRSLIKTYKYEKVLLLEPATFVDDGTRIVIDDVERWKQFKILKGLYDEFNVKYECIPFKGDYVDRFERVLKIIEADLGK